MRSIFIVLFFSLVTAFAAKANNEHDIHLSLCELRFNEATSSFEVSIKIFIDDLESAIAKDQAKKVVIGTDPDNEETDEYIAAYIDKHFSIVLDGARIKGEFLGKEITDDLLAVWCHIEFPLQKSFPRKCTLTNSILFEVYDDQRNIMDIRMNRSHKDYAIFAVSPRASEIK